MRARFKHNWRAVDAMAERSALGFHPISSVRQCLNCGSSQSRESTYNGTLGRNGLKVTGHIWRPKVERCRFVDNRIVSTPTSPAA